MILIRHSRAANLFGLFFLLFHNIPVFAENQTQVRAWIEPRQNIVVSQQVNLFIEVATPRWFTAGTRIGNFEIDQLVVLRREKFAVNSTRRIGPDTWSIQLWSITLYPQRDGEFVIPALNLMVSVADENGETIELPLKTSAIVFQALIPTEIPTESAWLATTRLEINERYDISSTKIEVGSAIKRHIEIKSENLAAMMLPKLQFTSVEGLAVYQSPPKVVDQVNRGDYLASREEVVTYVVEQAGTYSLPQIDLYWWDLASESLQHEILPQYIISTLASPSTIEAATAREAESGKDLVAPSIQSWVALLLGLLAAFILLCWFGFRKGKLNQHFSRTTESIKLERHYRASCEAKNYQQASALLFQWINHKLKPSELSANESSIRNWLKMKGNRKAIDQFEKLMAAAHGRTEVNNRGFTELLSIIKKSLPVDKPSSAFHKSVALRLN